MPCQLCVGNYVLRIRGFGQTWGSRLLILSFQLRELQRKAPAMQTVLIFHPTCTRRFLGQMSERLTWPTMSGAKCLVFGSCQCRVKFDSEQTLS